jgi:light-regulated signal transduction histidine kinase (bacteriophytochrome)
MILRKFVEWIVSWTSLQLDLKKLPGKEKRTFAELEKKILELEKLIEQMSVENNEIQTAFFRNLYHEIRTPMNSILGFSSLLHNNNLTAEKRNLYTEQVWKSSIIFLQFIDDLVEASLLETQRTELEPGWFYINDMLQEVYQSCNRYRHMLDKTNIVLLLNKPKDQQNVHIEADRKRLHQMMECLITDSIMGTERGIIELGCVPILNNGLSFYIKITPVGPNDNAVEPVIRKMGINSGSYGFQIRKRIADKLLNIMGGAITTDRNKGVTTLRIVLNPVRISTTGTIPENKPTHKRMAI